MKLLFVLCIAFLGCKSRTHNEVGAAPKLSWSTNWIETSDDSADWIERHSKIRTPIDKTTYLFHWTRNKDVLTRPVEVLKGIVDSAADQNKNFDKTTQAPGGGIMSGFGLYLANDPFSSSGFGETLVIVPIKRNNEFAVNKGVDYPLIRSDAWGILYGYDGLLISKGKRLNAAVVVRNEGLVEWNRLKVIDAPFRPFDLTQTLPLVIDRTAGWRRLLEANLVTLKAATMFSDILSRGKFSANELEHALLFQSRAKFRFLAMPKKPVSDFSVCVRENSISVEDCFSLWLGAASASLLGATVTVDFPLEQAAGLATELGLVQPGKTYSSMTELAKDIAPALAKLNPTVVANIRNLVTLRQMILSDLEKEGMSQWIQQ